MSADEDVRSIALRRLRELEKQAARLGSRTDPAILIEIEDIRRRYPDATVSKSRQRRTYTGNLDFDWLNATVASALRRIKVLEDLFERDSVDREKRQEETDHFRDAQTLATQQIRDDIGDLRDWIKAFAVVSLVALVLSVVIAIAVF